MKLLTVVGARPQFVKAAIVSRAIRQHNDVERGRRITEILLHTGQHFDFNMSELFFAELELPAVTHHLGIGGLGHAAMTGRMMEGIDSVLDRDSPDVVLVYGDTNSTLAGALTAAKRHIPVAHVEAGVRSFNRRMPEEINRILTDQLSRWLFCPTPIAVENLRRAGVGEGGGVEVHLVGDVMYDSWLTYRKLARTTPAIANLIECSRPDYYLATVHREENTVEHAGVDRLATIVSTLDRIAEVTPVLMIVHPRIRSALQRLAPRRMRMLEPVGYFDMMALVGGCRAVMTDSGGLQKEAYFAGKPCITLREETEWTELITHHAAVLVGAEPARILEAEHQIRTGALTVADDKLYGVGNAAGSIVEALANAAL
jgi:UDP-GlcNAc3NAcA epimerase